MKRINNLLNQIKNAQKNKKLIIQTNIASRSELNLLKILSKRGVILSYLIENSKCTVFLKYSFKGPAIQNIKVFSKINSKNYTKNENLKKMLLKQPFNIFILSTSLGLMDEKTAKQWNLGGELLAIIETI